MGGSVVVLRLFLAAGVAAVVVEDELVWVEVFEEVVVFGAVLVDAKVTVVVVLRLLFTIGVDVGAVLQEGSDH